ncbi:MAG: TIGR00725 family protein [Omnitrophica WOR_2 bacterium GWF2_38_59]|nr:MAG: TIGR00725 family protein [Omnitrophica WOR_2 bacterium GWA2_37_7]OGX24510.1 MAG: TIGR00725 family protein [Omnitrophica WOR_2 bacterium GWF2_38_59]OGX50456.1 MAG: TIGR00725 family protein [Omnitrophica WOR_2 bacterium RIFOXYA2_FULL_38_17]OGX54527.1 MAG: TIGR00725 family protein [Omnitrophica WOR_2 bacterium RIFOXYA12_FULL_38_10]OGX54952.1 MAG: TIGR00725 family protein [Omnitrophica WOR_2 bacterium RIFOXYC2_FULL_38_12]OGX60542.1 MAG: TIGR00725 family protein [Omnitrophica WOR_2 bacteriu
MNNQQIVISVIGGHEINKEVERLAYKVGKIIAEMGAVLVCGGLGGVMKAAAKGCYEADGLTIGLLPGKDKSDANQYIKIALPTTIGFARNAMVASSADIIIALPGSHGTACEIAYGFVYKRPIIDMGNWDKEGMIKVNDIKKLKGMLKILIKDKRS